MAGESQATKTASAPHPRARSAVRTTIGLPQMSASGFSFRREDDMRAGTITTKPMASPSLVGGFDTSGFLFLGREFSRFLGEHHRDFSVKREAERALGALHFRLLLIKMKRPLADGADQNFGKAAVHNIVVSMFG